MIRACLVIWKKVQYLGAVCYPFLNNNFKCLNNNNTFNTYFYNTQIRISSQRPYSWIDLSLCTKCLGVQEGKSSSCEISSML